MRVKSEPSTPISTAITQGLKAALPTAIALGMSGANPVASAAVGAAVAAGSTVAFSSLGRQLAGLETSLTHGIESAVPAVEHAAGSVLSAVGSVISGTAGAVYAVAAPVVIGIGAIINAVA